MKPLKKSWIVADIPRTIRFNSQGSEIKKCDSEEEFFKLRNSRIQRNPCMMRKKI